MTDRAPVPQPCPNRAPARSEAPVPPCPSPIGGTARGTDTDNQREEDRAPRRELVAALRRVAMAYARCPNPPDANDETWLALEAEIDAAFAAGHLDTAHNAIRAWGQHAIQALGVADDA